MYVLELLNGKGFWKIIGLDLVSTVTLQANVILVR